jgi:hypothetical protein
VPARRRGPGAWVLARDAETRTIPVMDMETRERRRLGTGLLVFGLIGVVLAGIMAAGLIGGAISARNLDERLQADQNRIAASLTRLTVSMESLALTTDHAGQTLQKSSDTLAGAQTVLGSVADTAVSISDALNVSILGSTPFAGAAERLQNLARTVTSFQTQTGDLAIALKTNATDAADMTAQIRQLKDQIGELATQVAAFNRIDEIVGLIIGGVVLGGLLTAWIAVGAALCAWFGWRLRRLPGAAPGGTVASAAS